MSTYFTEIAHRLSHLPNESGLMPQARFTKEPPVLVKRCNSAVSYWHCFPPLMPNPIPDFDHNLVIPPHLGDPTSIDQLSPYRASTKDLCEKLCTSVDRKLILEGLLDFRECLRSEGIVEGFQWIDGSFLEDVERRERRSPRDIDVLTVYWIYDIDHQDTVAGKFPAFVDRRISKAQFKVDHFPLDMNAEPELVIDSTLYWIQLFSHNRSAVWKGMLRIDLNTPETDIEAREILTSFAP